MARGGASHRSPSVAITSNKILPKQSFFHKLEDMLKYIQGAFFIVLASIISVINDACMKDPNTSASDTLFLRFLVATIALLPFVINKRKMLTQTKWTNHIIRASMFAAAMFFYLSGLKQLPLAFVIAVNFSIPLWVVILACLFLGEKWDGRLKSVLIGLSGVLITCIPIWESAKIHSVLVLILGAIGFASLDVFNKHLLNKEESMLMMLFGSSLFQTMLYAPFFSYTMPQNIWLYVYLGIGSNLLLYFILKAWQCCDISSLQPVKYIEFPLALYIGSIVFNDKLNWIVIGGVCLLLCGVFLNMREELKGRK